MRTRVVLPMVVALLATVLVACRAASPISPSPTPTATPTGIVAATPETTQAPAYPYAQPLNMLDDAYRNYYEIFVGSFYDSNDDGKGDLHGVVEMLDYVNDGNPETHDDLGFTGLWLMPIMPSPSYHKYDITDFQNIDPAYGSMADFNLLAAACKERDITLLIDFPFNHTSREHPWFIEARTYLQALPKGATPDPAVCPTVDYYHFARDKQGAKGWHAITGTEWFYEGVFWEGMPDLALENEAVWVEIDSITKFWLANGATGFRLDAAKEYFTGVSDKNIAVLTRFREIVEQYDPNAYIVGEVWDTQAIISRYYESGITSFFNFPVAQSGGAIFKAVRNIGGAKSIPEFMLDAQSIGAANPNFVDAPFLSNHDTTRAAAQYVNDPQLMKLAAGVLLTMNGSPFVYYGEELGMNSKGAKDENKRLAMHWSDTNLVGTPHNPPNADVVEQQFPPLDVQQDDPTSIYHYYKRAVRLRNENPALARGTVTPLPELTSGTVYALAKEYEGVRLVILYNTGETAQTVTIAPSLSIRGYLTVDDTAVALEGETLTLPPRSIAILK